MRFSDARNSSKTMKKVHFRRNGQNRIWFWGLLSVRPSVRLRFGALIPASLRVFRAMPAGVFANRTFAFISHCSMTRISRMKQSVQTQQTTPHCDGKVLQALHSPHPIKTERPALHRALRLFDLLAVVRTVRLWCVRKSGTRH